MPHGASSFVRTLADRLRNTDCRASSTEAQLFLCAARVGPAQSLQLRGGERAIILMIMAACLTGLIGCSTSMPRFRTPPSMQERPEDEDEARFATKIKDEVAREDDRKVDISQIGKELTRRQKPSSHYLNITPPGLDRDKVLLDVISYLGVPYAYGGTSKQGIDCSGFTSRIYESAAGRILPRSALAQYGVGEEIQPDSLEFGDLVFFNTTGRLPSHVGLYLEDDLFAHASVTSGVTISSLESTYYRRRFVGARRVVQ
jgi:cell wall-associated NlpC family hydrolase